MPSFPIFIDKYQEHENDNEIIVVGMTNGLIHFVSKNIYNVFRYEEAVLGYCLGNYSLESNRHAAAVVVVGRDDSMYLFPELKFLDGKLPNFLEAAKNEIEELRQIVGD